MRLKSIFAILLIPCALFADGTAVEIANEYHVTNTAVTASAQLKGYVESVYVDITGTTTGTLTITSGDETLLTATLSADTPYRPRYITCDNTGVELGAGTNGWARYLLNTEPLTFTLSETAGVTNTYKIKVKIARDNP